MSDRRVCQSCDQQRLELHSVKSNISPGINLILCKVCINKGYEPRFIIMIALSQMGVTPEIRKIVEENRYEGNPITLSEYLGVDK